MIIELQFQQCGIGFIKGSLNLVKKFNGIDHIGSHDLLNQQPDGDTQTGNTKNPSHNTPALQCLCRSQFLLDSEQSQNQNRKHKRSANSDKQRHPGLPEWLHIIGANRRSHIGTVDQYGSTGQVSSRVGRNDLEAVGTGNQIQFDQEGTIGIDLSSIAIYGNGSTRLGHASHTEDSFRGRHRTQILKECQDRCLAIHKDVSGLHDDNIVSGLVGNIERVLIFLDVHSNRAGAADLDGLGFLFLIQEYIQLHLA